MNILIRYEYNNKTIKYEYTTLIRAARFGRISRYTLLSGSRLPLNQLNLILLLFLGSLKIGGDPREGGNIHLLLETKGLVQIAPHSKDLILMGRIDKEVNTSTAFRVLYCNVFPS